MATSQSPESLAQLYRDLGFKRLSHWWGRGEMFLGLLCMAASVFAMLYLAVELLLFNIRKGEAGDGILTVPMIAATILFALGGYLALAGHRRHLYESNDRLTAYLAGLLRSQTARPAATPDAPAPNGPAAPPATDGRPTTEART
ncbi:MAG TPA: hypothetical protein VKE74_35595 [Gemmataceae bacterium]|nr:hypothetical protein [Gemmataceae bacterium]